MSTLYDTIVFQPTEAQKQVLKALDSILENDRPSKAEQVSWNYVYNFRTLNWALPRLSGKTTLLTKLAVCLPHSILLTDKPVSFKGMQSKNMITSKTFDYILVDEQDIDLRSLAVHIPKLIVRLYTPK